MKNKKIITFILLVLFCVTLNVLFFSVDKKTTIYSLNSEFESISVMVYDEDIDEYVKQNSIPTGDYELNEELSYCEGKGHVDSYDSELGKVTTKIKGSDKCYFYFDIISNIFESFTYQNKEETWIVPVTGIYIIEAWGAQGGSYNDTYHGGYGGYSTGEIRLTKGTILYINVGGAPTNSTVINQTTTGGYNGGGDGKARSDCVNNAGGGASHVALVSGKLSTLESHKSDNQILIVAGGGGGNSYLPNSFRYGIGGNGGGIEGTVGRYNQTSSSNCESYGLGGTQSSGGSYYVLSGHAFSSTINIPTAGFGYGSAGDASVGGSGGGGGWYGGRGTSCIGGGGGGSGYIGNTNLINKHMTCYECITDTNINTNTNTNTCVSASATSDCSKTGNGQINITYKSNNSTFSYIGNEQTWTIPKTGTYKLEVWGAQGGNVSTYIGGYGAYATGTISLTQGTILYVNIGGQGIVGTQAYNGGGLSTKSDGGAGGGGATHIALVSGELKNNTSHINDNQILIVAGGGGGANKRGENYGEGNGGNAGGIQGNNGQSINNSNNWGYNYGLGGTQNGGGHVYYSGGHAGSEGIYTEWTYSQDVQTYSVSGSFGQGGCGINNITGGGSGWYGGGGSAHGAGGGGSSYIGNSNLTNKHMTCYNCTTSTVTSTYTNSNSCVSGDPTADCSKTGNGFAKITFIS